MERWTLFMRAEIGAEDSEQTQTSLRRCRELCPPGVTITKENLWAATIFFEGPPAACQVFKERLEAADLGTCDRNVGGTRGAVM